jgi:S-formylglutathione hydrolase
MADWKQVEIAGKQADILFPGTLTPESRAVLFLHGHGRITLRGSAVYSDLLQRMGWVCVCPHGQRSWWGDRICREFDSQITPVEYLLHRVLPWMQREFGMAPPSIGLIGVSMGGQGALRLAYRRPALFPVVAALAPAIDFQIWYGKGLPLDEMYDSAEAVRQDTATLLIHPLNWPRHQLLMCDPTDAEWFEGTERLAGKLFSTGIPFESDFTTRHGGHTWEYLNHIAPRVIEFLNERLLQESRRIPTIPGIESTTPRSD